MTEPCFGGSDLPLLEPQMRCHKRKIARLWVIRELEETADAG